MKKSFRLRLIFLFLLCILFVTMLNRFFSQHIANSYVHERIEMGMVKVLWHCGGEFENGIGAHACSQDVRASSWMESLPQSYVFCPAQGQASGIHGADVCAQSRAASSHWGLIADPVFKGFEASAFVWQQQNWHAVRQIQTGRVLMVSQAVMDAFVEELWGIRNRVMLYVFPIILLMMLLVSWFMSKIMLKPLTDIESTLGKLSTKNLSEPLAVVSDYREFEKFTAVFDELRGRLHNSFLQSQRFAADASHELRTPLTILRGHIELGIAQLPAGSEAQIRMRLMGEEIERLIDITEKLLLLSKADANSIKLEWADLNLSALLNEFVADAKVLQPHLTVTTDMEPNIIWRCDKGLVNQLIQNIFSNAMHYNLPNGWLDFKLHRVADAFELVISNPTQGVVQDLSGRAFERFYRGDSAHTRHVDGHGLGLSLCIEIVHLHHGRMTLRADDKQVVHVTIKAPLVPPETWVG